MVLIPHPVPDEPYSTGSISKLRIRGQVRNHNDYAASLNEKTGNN